MEFLRYFSDVFQEFVRIFQEIFTCPSDATWAGLYVNLIYAISMPTKLTPNWRPLQSQIGKTNSWPNRLLQGYIQTNSETFMAKVAPSIYTSPALETEALVLLGFPA